MFLLQKKYTVLSCCILLYCCAGSCGFVVSLYCSNCICSRRPSLKWNYLVILIHPISTTNTICHRLDVCAKVSESIVPCVLYVAAVETFSLLKKILTRGSFGVVSYP